MTVKPQIAVQMMTVFARMKELGIYGTLKTLKEMGYNAAEISTLPMNSHNVKELKRAQDDLSFNVCSLSCSTVRSTGDWASDVLGEDNEKLIADAELLNCKYVRIGSIPNHLHGSASDYARYADELNHHGEQLHKHGLKLFYHNHHYDFAKVDGKYLHDILVERTDPRFVGFELDVHWLHRGGLDPVSVIDKLKGRIELIHLKDLRVVAPKTFETDDDFLNGGVEFAELGEGNLDLVRIIEASIAAGAEYLQVEQDRTYGRDPFESLEMSLKYLQKVGYGAYF